MNDWLELRLPGYKEIYRGRDCILVVKEDEKGTHVISLRLDSKGIIWPLGFIRGSTSMLVEKRS